jgi:hypothetical protein
MPKPPDFGPLPGQFAIRNFLTNTLISARDGGHHSIDALVTDATAIGENERFFFERTPPGWTVMKTANNYYVSASHGGGVGGNQDDTQTFQTERTALADDAVFAVTGPNISNGTTLIATFNHHFVTALGGGGKSTRAFHTDAVKASTWEQFYVLKCGDLGDGYKYAIRPAGSGNIPGKGEHVSFLTALGGGNRVAQAMTANNTFKPESRFTFERQPDGTYALRTSNGINVVTADGGGGLAHGSPQADNLQTNRTVIQGWERFKIQEHGSGLYTIQTTSGFFVAVKNDFTNISTRISFPDEAPSIGYTAVFELMMIAPQG